MKAYDNGAFFTVTFNQSDCDDFSRTWPCSSVRGRGSFQFHKSGDLVDATGAAARGENGSDWLAFSEDCQIYGQHRLAGRENLDRVPSLELHLVHLFIGWPDLHYRPVVYPAPRTRSEVRRWN